MQAYRKSKRNMQQPVSVPGGLKPDWYQNLAAGQEPFTTFLLPDMFAYVPHILIITLHRRSEHPP